MGSSSGSKKDKLKRTDRLSVISIVLSTSIGIFGAILACYVIYLQYYKVDVHLKVVTHWIGAVGENINITFTIINTGNKPILLHELRLEAHNPVSNFTLLSGTGDFIDAKNQLLLKSDEIAVIKKEIWLEHPDIKTCDSINIQVYAMVINHEGNMFDANYKLGTVPVVNGDAVKYEDFQLIESSRSVDIISIAKPLPR